MTDIITIKQNDTYPPLRAYLQMRTGVPIRIEGATVRLILKDADGATHLNEIVDIDDFNEGAISYKWLPANTSTAGEFRGEFEITWLDGSIVTVPNDEYFILNIVKDLGGA
ncbi:MAG TPA: hypothetical protein VFC79_08615 [Tissierellaceae bacterium]|nr:hypothetical protein [Tissierellaceae bacterium]